MFALCTIHTIFRIKIIGAIARGRGVHITAGRPLHNDFDIESIVLNADESLFNKSDTSSNSAGSAGCSLNYISPELKAQSPKSLLWILALLIIFARFSIVRTRKAFVS